MSITTVETNPISSTNWFSISDDVQETSLKLAVLISVCGVAYCFFNALPIQTGSFIYLGVAAHLGCEALKERISIMETLSRMQNVNDNLEENVGNLEHQITLIQSERERLSSEITRLHNVDSTLLDRVEQLREIEVRIDENLIRNAQANLRYAELQRQLGETARRYDTIRTQYEQERVRLERVREALSAEVDRLSRI